MEREFSLLFHLLGFGTLVTLAIAGNILESKYKKAPDLQTKAVLLGALKSIGILSPIAILVQLLTGLGNMHALAISFSDFHWLQIKLVLFVIAAILGGLMGVQAKKRGVLVMQMLQGKAPADAAKTLEGMDKVVGMLGMILPVLLLAILCLSIYGRLGGQ